MRVCVCVCVCAYAHTQKVQETDVAYTQLAMGSTTPHNLGLNKKEYTTAPSKT